MMAEMQAKWEEQLRQMQRLAACPFKKEVAAAAAASVARQAATAVAVEQSITDLFITEAHEVQSVVRSVAANAAACAAAAAALAESVVWPLKRQPYSLMPVISTTINNYTGDRVLKVSRLQRAATIRLDLYNHWLLFCQSPVLSITCLANNCL
jgi:hypothetical protein